MNQIIEAITNYAKYIRMPAYLLKDEAYEASETMAQKQIEILKHQLPETEKQRFENILAEMSLMHKAEIEAMCLAGISIGQELSRL